MKTRVMLPNFLGIGVPKAGSTWLYELLASHPEVWVPHEKREVQFFNMYFDRRVEWYMQFFPTENEASRYSAVGEVTPHYFYCDRARIKEVKRILGEDTRLILILRDPVERVYSHYWFLKRIKGLNLSFEDFLEKRPVVADWSSYACHLERWLEYFDRDQFLIMVFEKDLRSVKSAKLKLADFLGLSVDQFPGEAGRDIVNKRHVPRYRKLYAWAVQVGHKLRDADMYWATTLARKFGVKNWFGNARLERKEMHPETRRRLEARYQPEIAELEEMTDMDLSLWLDGVKPKRIQ